MIYKLLQIALGKNKDFELPVCTDWTALVQLSIDHGVAGLVLDALQKVFDNSEEAGRALDIPKDQHRRLFSYAMKCEKLWKEHTEAVSSLARFYSKHGFEMTLLKGHGISLCYPVPEHRPSGDIDIYLHGHCDEADAVLSKEVGVRIDRGKHHHTVFNCRGITVENHFDFINVESHRSNAWIEKRLKELCELPGAQDMPGIPGCKLPPPDFNALFVTRHGAKHFAATEMNLRQLLDWALLIESIHEKVDWTSFWRDCKSMNMHRFVMCCVRIAVDRLGFDEAVFHVPAELYSTVDSRLVSRVEQDILSTGDGLVKDKGPLVKVLSKAVRWWKNRWKHELVYSDSLLSTFFFQLRSHLMKPGTILDD